MNQANRLEQVWSALGEVTDPEIDESVTTLKFVTGVEIEGDSRIRIKFRLPTYWCAPNFAFLMASDMRDAVAQLPWVEDVSVELLDHFSANLINHSVARKQDFRDAFPGETDGDLSQLRQTFLGKSYQRRQELLLRHVLRKELTLLGSYGQPCASSRRCRSTRKGVPSATFTFSAGEESTPVETVN